MCIRPPSIDDTNDNLGHETTSTAICIRTDRSGIEKTSSYRIIQFIPSGLEDHHHIFRQTNILIGQDDSTIMTLNMLLSSTFREP